MFADEPSRCGTIRVGTRHWIAPWSPRCPRGFRLVHTCQHVAFTIKVLRATRSRLMLHSRMTRWIDHAISNGPFVQAARNWATHTAITSGSNNGAAPGQRRRARHPTPPVKRPGRGCQDLGPPPHGDECNLPTGLKVHPIAAEPPHDKALHRFHLWALQVRVGEAGRCSWRPYSRTCWSNSSSSSSLEGLVAGEQAGPTQHYAGRVRFFNSRGQVVYGSGDWECTEGSASRV